MSGYARLAAAVFARLVEDYARYYEEALLREYRIHYLSRALEACEREGRDASLLRQVLEEAEKDVEVEDLDSFFATPLGALVCEFLGVDARAAVAAVRRHARRAVPEKDVRRRAFQEARALYMRIA